jgi:hypothetical protein
MRHVLLPGAITAGPRGMPKPATMARLIAPAGGTPGVGSGLSGALAGAVYMAAIATAADHHLGAAADTEEQPRRNGVSLIGPAGPLMTGAAIAAILPRHACPARCGARCRSETWQLDLGTVLAAYRAAPAPLAPAGSQQPTADRPRTRSRPALFRPWTPSGFIPPMERRQVYADSDRRRHRLVGGEAAAVAAVVEAP